MLDWTGERYLPWIEDAAIAYEHLHRYFYAAQFVKDKRVLDLASGEGYGANRLAASARCVTGVDIDPTAVRHARAKYPSANLKFTIGSISEIPLAPQSFDVITCFEAIEHIEDQSHLLSEVKRVLAPDGIFLVSTPNKIEYQHDGESNPFHVKELSPEEFEAALRQQFSNVQFLGQRIYPQSSLWRLDSSGGRITESLIQRTPAEFDVASPADRVPVYILAIASNGPIPDLDSSVLVDISDQLVRQKDASIADLIASKASNEASIRWLNQQIRAKEEGLRWQAAQLESLNRSIESLNGDIAWQKQVISDRDLTIQEREEALKWRSDQVRGLEHEIVLLKETAAALNRNLETIISSTGWRWVLRFCSLRDGLCPPGSRRRQLVTRLLARSGS